MQATSTKPRWVFSGGATGVGKDATGFPWNIPSLLEKKQTAWLIGNFCTNLRGFPKVGSIFCWLAGNLFGRIFFYCRPYESDKLKYKGISVAQIACLPWGWIDYHVKTKDGWLVGQKLRWRWGWAKDLPKELGCLYSKASFLWIQKCF